MQKKYHLFLVAFFIQTCLYAQTTHRELKTAEYKNLQHKLSRGWNTWYNNSVISHVLLPQNFAINLCVTNQSSPEYIKEVFKASDIKKRPEKVDLGLRSDDGSYTSMRLFYRGKEISIQTATDGDDELILITPIQESSDYLIAEAGLMWSSEGFIGMKNNVLVGQFPNKTITVKSTITPIPDGYTSTTAPRLTFSLKKEFGIFTGKTRSLAAIKAIMAKSRAKQQKRVDSYGDMASSFKAMQTILAWNTIYDAPNHRVITPVSRSWSYGWGAGYVLFDWDTYFASYMLASFNKDLAYANAIEITKAITPGGFIPNYQSISRGSSLDRSQPPIGSTVILNIYKKYREKWFLQEVYDELLTWNRWWPKNRINKGYLAWGSHNPPDMKDPSVPTLIQFAKYESGLDNSPMYDGVPFNSQTHTLELADVGLMSMYVMDCNSLAEIAIVLGKKADADELNKRSAVYKHQLNTLWDEKTGIYLNKRLDNDEPGYRLTPTNFYPMLAKACSQQQAERMIKEHYFNTDEFYGEYGIPSVMKNDPAFADNDYWRGRIWGPLNFLVYLGLRNYDVKQARTDLIERSKKLFLKSWKKDGSIYENYNSVTGDGDDVVNADGYYHWGALLAFMEFIEKGYMDPSK